MNDTRILTWAAIVVKGKLEEEMRKKEAGVSARLQSDT